MRYRRQVSKSVAELKGAVLLGMMRDAKTLPGGIPNLLEKMPADVRATYFAASIVHSMWYSYRALAALLDAYSQVLGHAGGADFREIGVRMAERDFTTLLKIYAMVATPTRLADVPRQIWLQRFRNAGVATSEAGDHNFRFTIAGFPGIHPMQCEILSGYGGAVGQRKAASFKTVHDRCVHRGGKDCSWNSTW